MSAYPITIRRLSTGWWHARGQGPCEWAQWPVGAPLRDEHFFAQASERFRRELDRREHVLTKEPAR